MYKTVKDMVGSSTLNTPWLDIGTIFPALLEHFRVDDISEASEQ